MALWRGGSRPLAEALGQHDCPVARVARHALVAHGVGVVAVALEGLAAEAALGRGELCAHLGLERGGVLSLQAVVGLSLEQEAALPIVTRILLWLARRALRSAAEVARGAAAARADAECTRAAGVPVEGLVAAVGALHGAAAVALQPAHDARHAACCWVWVSMCRRCLAVR